MKINRNNYEAFLLDYFEKELDPSSVAELMIFLEQNPDLKDEFENYENFSLIPDLNISFPDKNSLKKNILFATPDINSKNYEEYFIASVENILTQDEVSQLNTFLALNPELLKDFALFQQTKLQPDTSIVFENKDSLRREKVVPVFSFSNKSLLYSVLAIAASLLIFVSVYVNVSKPGLITPVANNTNSVQKQTQPNSIPSEIASVPAQKSASSESGKTNVPNKISNTTLPEVALAINKGRNPEGFSNPSPIQSSASDFIEIAQASQIFASATGFASRTYYSDIYKYVRMREEVDYQQYVDDMENKSLLARTVNIVREKVFGTDCMEAQKTPADKGLWAVATAGVKGINYITNSNIEIRRKTDHDGNTTAYAIASSRFEYSRDLRK